MFPSEFDYEENCNWLEEHTGKCIFWMPDSKFKCDYIGRQDQCKEFKQVIK